jgi:processive 1,2-diacylglycerol beta-glucosyltransferase
MILILYVNSGAGSRSLADVISRELANKYIDNKIVSLHNLIPSWLNSFLFGNYEQWCNDGKNYFSWIYSSRYFYPLLYKVLPLLLKIKGNDKKLSASDLIKSADAIICCSFFCAWFAKYYQRLSGVKRRIYGVLGDYTISPGWQLSLDGIFTSHQYDSFVFDYIKKSGGSLHVSGVPANSFCADNLVMKGNVLLCGGGWGLGITTSSISKILSVKNLRKLIVVCGTNHQLYNCLCGEFENEISQGVLEVFAFVDDMSSVYSQIGVVITKAGGLTLTEAALLCKPIIICGYLPGHEEKNMEVFTKHNAAVYAPDSYSLCEELAKILSGDKLSNVLTQNASMLVNEDASMFICNTVSKELNYVDA